MTHTGEKAHKCHQYLPCVHAPSFKIQMRTHMGEMSYKCSQCNYTCTRVTNLHTHMLTHTEVRAFNCDQCIKYSHEKVIFIKHSTDSSGGNKHVSGFSHTCVENCKHLQTYNCVAFFTHVCLFPYLCVKIQTCVENSTQV